MSEEDVYRYHPDDLDYIFEMASDIKNIAAYLGISPTAVAGAIVEELTNRRYESGFKSGVSDWLKGDSPSWLTDNVPSWLDGGVPPHSELLDQYNYVTGPDFDYAAFARLYRDLNDNLVDRQINKALLFQDKFDYEVLLDFGPARVQLRTAINLLSDYLQDLPQVGPKGYSVDPLDLRKYQNDYQLLASDLSNPNNLASIKFASLMVREAQEFFKTNAPREWGSLTQDQQDALTITYYNRGREVIEANMVEYYSKVGSSTRPLPPEYRPRIGSGGISHLHIDNENAVKFFYERGLLSADGKLTPDDWAQAREEYARTHAEDLEGQEESPGPMDADAMCFAAGTPVQMADGSEKPIEQIEIGEWVMAFDSDADHGRGALMPSRVTRTMINHGQLLLDFHGTKVTPGHVFLTGNESPTGKGVFKRLIDILVEDGTVVNVEGVVLRAATNFPINSPEDHFIEVAEIWAENGSISSRSARLRAGTWLIGENGTAATLLDTIAREGFKLLPDGRVSHRGGPSQPMLMQAPAPRPETFILKRSGLTLEQIYAHASLRDVEPVAMAAHGLRRDGVTAVRCGDESDGPRLEAASDAPDFRLSHGWTPSAVGDNGLLEPAGRSTANRATRRKVSVEARKQAKQRLH